MLDPAAGSRAAGVTRAVAPFIDGALSASASETAVEIFNPSTGRVLHSVAAGSTTDVDRAVSSARRAFESGSWRDLPPSRRKQTLHRFAELILHEASVLDALDAEEMGKPVSLARSNAATAGSLMRFYAEAVDKVSGDTFVSDPRSLVLQRRVPRGVVAAIVPWNFPTHAAVLKIAPALAAGNCVVLKPSEQSSRSAVRIAQLGLEAGVPSGVLNVVTGLGETVGRALGLHMDVDMLTFTGSTEVGGLMLQYAGRSNLKAVVLECGGKSPHVVFDDGVDLDAVAESIARSLLANQGQICSLGSRLLVEKSIEESLLQRIATRTQSVVMGNALDPGTTFGPLASSRQYARVMRYVENAAAQGATTVVGGRRVLEESGGYFVEPTVFRNVRPDAAIAQEEVFGPLLAVTAFADDAEAVRLANRTKYGLAAYVWTARLATGMRMAQAIRSTVWINAVAPSGEGAGNAASYEPCGQSGFGVEGGLAGMESYLRRQLISVAHG